DLPEGASVKHWQADPDVMTAFLTPEIVHLKTLGEFRWITTVFISVQKMKEERKWRQPGGVSSAGCFFKNPLSGPSAGELIEKVGLKGKRVGGAEISSRHANFIINRGGATCREVITLIQEIRNAVKDNHGIVLEPEVLLMGKNWKQVL
ncbi:MAG: hypothetical protein GY757_57690, partial [bacterium]|nr:hypothetical protein [bacterium]